VALAAPMNQPCYSAPPFLAGLMSCQIVCRAPEGATTAQVR
jgi:hypothetical protein